MLMHARCDIGNLSLVKLYLSLYKSCNNDGVGEWGDLIVLHRSRGLGSSPAWRSLCHGLGQDTSLSHCLFSTVLYKIYWVPL